MIPWEGSETKNAPFMSVVSRAFGSRNKGSDPQSPLDKVLKDLNVGERENADLPAVNGAVVRESVTVPPDHRQRLEKLLSEAREIEQQLANEAAEAALAENLNLEEKRAGVAQFAETERAAEAQAQPLATEMEAAASHRVRIDAELRAARQKLAAAEDSVQQLESRLTEAHGIVAQEKSRLAENERRAENAAQQADQIAARVDASARHIADCREARTAAEADLRKAELTARNVAQTAATLKQIRELSESGLDAQVRAASP